jgi:chaperonin GroES
VAKAKKKTTSAKATAGKTTKKPTAKKAPGKKAVGTKTAAKKAASQTTTKKAAPKAAGKTAAKGKTSASKTKPAAQKVNSNARKTQASAGKASSNMKWDQFLTPLDDRVIVETTAGEKMTAGGLYIPDTASGTSGNFKGVVLVAGRGHRDEKGKVHPMDVQAGDTVLFSEFSGAKMDLLGKEVRILRESEILGIVTKK